MPAHRVTSLLTFLILSLLNLQNAQADRVLVVGLYSEGLPPYSFEKGSPRKGIYLDVLDEVMAITGDRYRIEYYPYARIAKTFSQGVIDIDPGNSPSWIKQEDLEFSIFTQPFWHYTEALISGIHNTETDVRGKTVGTIRGYYYTGEASMDTLGYIPHQSTNEKNQFKMLMGGRYDFILSGSVVTKYLSKINKFPIKEIKSFGPTPLSFRLHSSQKKLQSRMDKALDSLISDKTIHKIVESYINTSTHDTTP